MCYYTKAGYFKSLSDESVEIMMEVEELEKEGLFGKGRAWERGRYLAEYVQLAGAYYQWFYEDHTTANYNPSSFGLAWDVSRDVRLAR